LSSKFLVARDTYINKIQEQVTKKSATKIRKIKILKI